MPRKNQEGKLLRKRLVDLDLTVDQAAKAIGRPRPTVSKALRTDKFPLVRKQLREALGV